MLAHHLLAQFAPASCNHLLFNPVSTGSPGFDWQQHLAHYPGHRINLEDCTRAGQLILRPTEFLARETDEAAVKILAPQYALRVLGHPDDATEFIRCARIIVGPDADEHARQEIARYYYQQARSQGVAATLKEMGLLALELAAVTANEEEREYAYEEQEWPARATPEPALNKAQRRQRQAALRQPLPFVSPDYEAHLAAVRRLLTPAVNALAQEDEFIAFATATAARRVAEGDEADADALYQSLELTFETYDEGGRASLHLDDSTHFHIVADLRAEPDADYLPEYARSSARQLQHAFIGGPGAARARSFIARQIRSRAEEKAARQAARQGQLPAALPPRPNAFRDTPLSRAELSDFIEETVMALYPRRVARTFRRCLAAPDERGRWTTTDLPQTRQVNPEADEMNYVSAILTALLEQYEGDFHLSSLRRNESYRRLHRALRAARDTGVVRRVKQEAYAAKQGGELSLKEFTALLTVAHSQEARLASAPLSPAAAQLIRRIAQAPAAWLRYLRWACYPGNEAGHVINTLPRQEVSRVWEALNARVQAGH